MSRRRRLYSAPPSIHPSGVAYSWDDETVPIAALPHTWLATMIDRAPVMQNDSTAYASPDDAARGLLAYALTNASTGTRNDQGFFLAFRLRDALVGEPGRAWS